MQHKGLLSVIFLAFMLTGCIYVNDSEDDRRNGRSLREAEPTVGQELLDLDRARSSGVISDNEYDRAKQAILNNIN